MTSHANVAQVERLLAGVQADLLVLPELANSGYMYAFPGCACPAQRACRWLGSFPQRVAAPGGVDGRPDRHGHVRSRTGGLYNSAVAVDAGGSVAVYRKTHLFFEEQDLFLPGDTGFHVFEHGGARIGMMICFDWYFPESARTLALRGAQIIAHPSNLVLPHCQTAMVTRCLENRVFAITTNRWGTESLGTAGEKALTFTGASQVLTPLGVRVAQAPVEGDCVALAEIDPAEADNKRPTVRNHLLDDRRPDVRVRSRDLMRVSSFQMSG